jgi:hypothetical protein
VKKSSTNLAVRESFIKTQTSLYLLRLNNDNINPLLKEAFHLSKILDKEGFYSWFTCVKNIVSEIGFDIELTEKCQTIKEVKQYKHIIKDSTNDYNKNIILNKIKNLNGNNKISLYKFLKQNENEMEYYLSHPYRNVRLILTKFRLSEHKHLIEIGRNLKIPRNQRLCAICNVLEDEFHFFFECKRNTNNGNILYQYFQNIYIIYSNFLELNHEEKLTNKLNPSIPEQIRTVTSFIELREGDSSQS